MGVVCITGRVGAGKTARCVDILREILHRGEQSLYLVPEQDTVETELDLARALEMQVMWNLEVMSPTRLARRIQSWAGGSARVWLSDAGRAMALKGAMMNLRGGLRYFRSAGQGAADLLGDFFVELKRGEADPLSLRLSADRLSADSALAQKLYDLAEIYESYEERMAGQYVDGEDALQTCAAQVCACPQLRGTTVIVDGFDVLPRTTLRLIAALGKQCRAVYVTFAVCGPDASDRVLYEQTAQSLHTLCEMCAQEGVDVRRENLPDRALANGEINHLARNLYAVRPEKWHGVPQSVHVVQARDPYMEAERAAGYLFEKCRKEGLRYRDMAVVCADMETYAQRLGQALARRGMRAYIDRQPPADTHPMAQYLIAAMTSAARYYRADDMLRCLKTGYCNLTSREADRLELYAMEHGLEGKLWELPIEEEEISSNQGEEPIRTLEEIRVQFVEPIAAFRVGGPTRAVRAFAEALVRLMDETDIPGQLAAAHKLCEEEGDVTRMQIIRQAQDAVNSVLDQAVELCGEEEMGLEDFIKLFRAGLQSVKIGSIPMSPDAVYVGELTRFKGRQVKLLYVVGTNADRIPARKQDNGLLAENEKVLLRDAAERAGVEVRVNLLSNRTDVERFAVYSALISPSEELVLSYAAVDPRGAAMRVSPMIVRLKTRVFPEMIEECGVMGDEYVYAGAKQSMKEALAAGLRACLGGAPITEEVRALYAAYAAAFPQDCRQMLRMLAFDGAVQPLNEETAHALYQSVYKQRKYGVDGMVAGISQLETFALCPFAHFITYGIRPRVLREPQMDVRERGTMEHRAVERFVSELYKQEGEVSDEEAERLMSAALEPLLQEDGERRRSQSGLVKAGQAEIRRTMRRMSRMMALQKRLSAFRVSAEEIAFTPADTPPLALEDGEKIYLEGKIDRVDVLELPDGEYARIIDYKTGNNTLMLDDVYYGLRLQLFLYLDAVLNMRNAHPAGIFYQKLGDAAVRLDGASIDEKTVEKGNKKLKLTGYILEDEKVISQMCTDPEWMDQVLPVTPKVKGGKVVAGQYTERSRERMLTEKQFDQLRRHTRRKLTALAQEILSGEAAVSPAQTSDLDACKYCSLRGICGFDESLAGCERRQLRMKSEDVLKAIEEEDAHA